MGKKLLALKFNSPKKSEGTGKKKAVGKIPEEVFL
jgi:hypothetical protein